MAALKEHVKLFIVQRLACFDTPSDVAAAVKEEFGIDIDRSHVGIYDPTTHKGRELGKKFREVFESTRQAVLEETSIIPIANRGFRLQTLQKLLQRALIRKNDVLAKEYLEQAAKETGGIYTNKMFHAGDKDNPLMVWLQQIGGTSLPIVQDVEGLTIENDVEKHVEVETKPTKAIVKRTFAPGRD